MVTYKVPFPWFGGKSWIAHLVWGRFGDVPNYCEPFFGSGAVLMLRPEAQWRDGRTETVNDLDSWLTNFWRAVKADPDGVASYADWPISEIDLYPYCYNTDDLLVAHDVREWALAHGDDPMMRIALCGYFEEHATKMPQNWECVSWKANLGYSGLRKSGVNYNRFKERIWFSPHCLKPQSRLF
jgi:hypothetical protein